MTSQVTDGPVEPVRILHVLDSLAPGGTELVSATLIERTAGRFQHAVCSLSGSGPPSNGVAKPHGPHHLSRQDAGGTIGAWRCASRACVGPCDRIWCTPATGERWTPSSELAWPASRS